LKYSLNSAETFLQKGHQALNNIRLIRLYMKRIFDRKILAIKVIGELLFLYGFLAWIDGIAIQLTNPMWLAMPVSHLFLWMRTDTFTILSFLVSAIGFFVWRFSAELIKSTQKETS
jgi:hypothetical protein